MADRRKILLSIGAILAIGCVGLSLGQDSADSDPTASTQLQAAATQIVAPTPTPTLDQIRAGHPAITDAREVFVRQGDYNGRPIALNGSVSQILIAPAGNGYELGDRGFLGFGDDTAVYRTAMILQVSGTDEYLVVGFAGDLPKVYEGDDITVYGSIVGTNGTTNAFGGSADRPLFEAVLINHGGLVSTPAA